MTPSASSSGSVGGHEKLPDKAVKASIQPSGASVPTVGDALAAVGLAARGGDRATETASMTRGGRAGAVLAAAAPAARARSRIGSCPLAVREVAR